ncbi:hypothetical protein KR059_011960 [Drosophila kikkawai]|nr:hypothetical protein KR059_011960 [Drosophila kikkawai]
MNKPSTVGTKKAFTATTKAKKKRSTKIVKGGKVKTKKSNASTSISKDSTIPAETPIATSDSWSLTQSIRQFVRIAVEDSLMETNIKRELAHKALAKEKIGHNEEYVKLKDLNDIVNKLIAQHTEAVIERHSEQVQKAADKVLSIEESLNKLTDRIKSVEDSVTEMRRGFLPTSEGSRSQRVGRVIGMTKPSIRFQLPNKELSKQDPAFVSSSMPRLGAASNTRMPSGSLQQKFFPSKSSDDSDDDSIDLQSNPSFTRVNNDKSRSYDEIIRKLSPKTIGKQSDLASNWSPSQLDVNPSMSSLEEDWQRRMAERRQIDTNMLRYKKSPLTLQLDSHKSYFPNEGPKTEPGPLTRGPPLRPVHPRLSRPGIPNSTDEAQSDWLFEQ